MDTKQILAEHLSINSAPYHDPLSYLPWESLSVEDYWLPPQALSLCGVPEFEQLNEATKIRVSQYEFISFIQSGMWLEEIFIDRLIKAARRTTDLSERTYLLHELREETGHSLMFLDLIKRSGLEMPGLKRQWPTVTDFAGRHLSQDSTLFWMAVVIGEEVPDKLNRQIRQLSGPQFNPLIREMCTLHIKDEARHIAYARHELNNRLARSGATFHRYLSPLINLLFNQFVNRFYFPQAEYYEQAGLSNGSEWRKRALRNPGRQEFVKQCVAPTQRLFLDNGIKLKLKCFG